MKIKIDESKILEFKIDTSSGCKLEDLQGYLRFSFGGVEYGFPAKIEEECFKVEVPPFQNVINDKLTESISKNKELIVKGRLDVIANNNTYVTPWQGDIDIEIPLSMNVSEGKLSKTQKFMVSDPDNNDIIDAFNDAFNPKPQEGEEKKTSFKDKFLDIKVEEKPEIEEEEKDLGSKYKCKPCGWIFDPVKQGKSFSEWDGPCPECGAAKSKFEKIGGVKEEDTIPKKSRFAQSLEKTYVRGGN